MSSLLELLARLCLRSGAGEPEGLPRHGVGAMLLVLTSESTRAHKAIEFLPGLRSEIEDPEATKPILHAYPRYPNEVFMHYSRLCALLIDCRTADVDQAAKFWADALGRAIDPNHPGTRGNYRMLETPPDEPIVQIQRVEHESRVHIDIETDNIQAEVVRLEALGAEVGNRLERWVVMQAPTGQRFCVVRAQRPGFPKNATRWD